MSLDYRRPEDGFLGLSAAEAAAPERAGAVIIPFGMEKTVSYGTGTARGAEAIIAASPELEFFDDELWCEPYRQFGIATLAPQSVAASAADALDQLAALTGAALDAGHFPLVLGGEHTLTAGAIRPFAARYPDLAVLHLDAHTDLRDSYEDNPLSHACAMRRVLDQGVEIVSAGIRAISAEEVPLLEATPQRVRVFWGRERASWSLEEIVAPLRGRPLYVSLDIDVLDAGIMPATGTPEPGGLSFDEVCAVLRAASGASRIVGADLVELAPIPGFHAYDFTAAKLAYKLLAYALTETG
ncbi:agmatinase [Dichotomicrobium thermohalophilum]|nr:agmatinase [Dichotomicrobium thermohalophilum]